MADMDGIPGCFWSTEHSEVTEQFCPEIRLHIWQWQFK